MISGCAYALLGVFWVFWKLLFNHNAWSLAIRECCTLFKILNIVTEPNFKFSWSKGEKWYTYRCYLRLYVRNQKIGGVTSFRIIFNLYVSEKPCAEMLLLKQIFQIIIRVSIWQGNLTYNAFLSVKWQIKLKYICSVVGTMSLLLSTLLY